MFKRLAVGIAAASLLSGCAVAPWNWTIADPWDYESVSKMPCKGTAFDAALQQEYVDLADYEYGGRYSGGDWDSVMYYTGKAQAAAVGQTPAPTDLSTIKSGSYTSELSTARADLVGVLGTGVAATKPRIAAKAQASFDCWAEEAVENRQPIRIQECRADFEKAMALLRSMPNGINFALGSTVLDHEAQRTIAHVADLYRTAKARGDVRLVVIGYTDTVGNPKFNLNLSQRRADTVVKALIARGVPARDIVTRAKGENELAVPTGDQVANRENRRVEIVLEY